MFDNYNKSLEFIINTPCSDTFNEQSDKIAQIVSCMTLPPSHYHLFYLIVSGGHSDLAGGGAFPLWPWDCDRENIDFTLTVLMI